MEKPDSKRICAICGHPEPLGIFLGYMFICRHCESEIVDTDVLDERYRFFVQQMKKFMLKKNA